MSRAAKIVIAFGVGVLALVLLVPAIIDSTRPPHRPDPPPVVPGEKSTPLPPPGPTQPTKGDPPPSQPPPPPNPPPPAPAQRPVGDYLGYRMLFTMSTECYSFAPNGQVELRHSGLPQVNDRGVYRNGQIVWESGRIPAKVIGSGQKIKIDDVDFEKIQSCLNL